MGSKNGLLIDIIRIRLTSPRVIRWEAQRIEILLGGDDWIEIVVVFVRWTGEAGFDDCPCYGNRVIFLDVQPPWD